MGKRYAFYMLGDGLDNDAFHMFPDVAIGGLCVFDTYIHIHWLKAWVTLVIRNNHK